MGLLLSQAKKTLRSRKYFLNYARVTAGLRGLSMSKKEPTAAGTEGEKRLLFKGEKKPAIGKLKKTT